MLSSDPCRGPRHGRSEVDVSVPTAREAGEGRLRARAALALLVALAGYGPAKAQEAGPTPVAYSIRYSASTPGFLTVALRPGRVELPQTLAIPRAIPMGYGEQPFERFVQDLEAVGPGDRPLTVTPGSGPRWIIAGAEGAVLETVRYRVDLKRLESEVRATSDTSKAREGYVGILGYCVLAYLEGHEARPADLRVEAPEGWPIFLTLAPQAPSLAGTATARAADYYALADSQILMGPDLDVRRVDGTPPLFVASYAETELDRGRVGAAGREALDALTAYFGTVPFAHYSIVVEVLRPISPEHEYGFSMEHMDSGTFFLDERGALTAASPDEQFRRVRYNYAHHIAHAWIPKRSYGAGYFPFSWSEAPLIDTIWFSEGFAQYAAIVALAEQMAQGGDAYVEQVLQQRFRQRLADAPDFIREMDTVSLSRLASTRYSEDFRTGASSFARGGMMAYEMDQRIRARTEGRRSLRDGLRHLIAWSARERRAFQSAQIPELLSEEVGVELEDIFARWMAAPGPR